MNDNIVQAQFNGRRNSVTTRSIYQWDYGMRIVFSGLDLPTAYTVHFANNAVGGSAVQMLGDADGVDIPDDLLKTGMAVYAWVFLHSGEDDGETVYMATIPVTKRPEPTDEQPTPEQQSALDQAIVALNEAVTDAETAVSHYPRIENGEWETWDVADGEYVSTGVQAQGPQGETGADGAPGRDGTDGTNGTDGVSPTATVEQTVTGATITVTDAQGTTTANITNGQNGAPGADGVGVPSGGTTGQVLAKTSGTDYATEWVTPYTGTQTVNVSGSTPSITGVADTRYMCGEVSTLDITPPESGIIDVIFTSGTTPTVLTYPNTVKFADGWDGTCEASTIYEINILNGTLGLVMAWT